MWLYVPSVSPLESEGSISPSVLQALAERAPSVTSRGKPFASPALSRAWKKGGWIRRLSGLTCEPLMLWLGVARWISFWVATPVSDSLLPANGSGTTTNETSGLTFGAPLPTADLLSSSSRTSALILDAASMSSLETYKAWVTRSRRHCSARRKSAHRIDANGSSSWLWPTAVAVDSRGFGLTHTKGGRDLATDSYEWGVCVPATWEAPQDEKGPCYPTPTLSHRTNRGGAAGRVGPTRLSLEVRASRGLLPGHHDLSTSTDGENTSPPSRSLNPLFVEVLQGLPTGWTDCAPSETR